MGGGSSGACSTVAGSGSVCEDGCSADGGSADGDTGSEDVGGVDGGSALGCCVRGGCVSEGAARGGGVAEGAAGSASRASSADAALRRCQAFTAVSNRRALNGALQWGSAGRPQCPPVICQNHSTGSPSSASRATRCFSPHSLLRFGGDQRHALPRESRGRSAQLATEHRPQHVVSQPQSIGASSDRRSSPAGTCAELPAELPVREQTDDVFERRQFTYMTRSLPRLCRGLRGKALYEYHMITVSDYTISASATRTWYVR